MRSPTTPLRSPALASAYETGARYEDAIEVYNRIPAGTALQAAIDIRKAFALNSLEKVDEAKVILERLAKESPDDLKPLDALGNILRSRKRYGEAADVLHARDAADPQARASATGASTIRAAPAMSA